GGVERHTCDLLQAALIVGKGLDHRVAGARPHTGIENVVGRYPGHAPGIRPVSVEFGLHRKCDDAEHDCSKRHLEYADHTHFTSTIERPRTLRPLISRKRTS